ncbi:ABC transporter ATP-binding protein [Bacillaceae bacterium]
MQESPVIRFCNVSKTYMTMEAEVEAVRSISFAIRKGEFVSLLGPSGCGKTTILSMLAGLIPPTEGSIEVFGQAMTGPSRRIGYMLQQDYLLGWRTVAENVFLGLEFLGQRNRENEAHALRWLDELGLADFADKYPAQLSGGMRQRVALVRTLATNPDILLLDEPFSALDYQNRLKLEDLVFSTLRKHGKTALLVTHDISEAVAMSDRIIVLTPHPGRMKTIVEMPRELREPLPLQSRSEPEFQLYFQTIWKELNE